MIRKTFFRSYNQINKRYLTILPMPKLSPTITSCKLLKWYIKEEKIKLSQYDLICEIETTSLTQTQNKYEIIKLDIEIQEECYLYQLLCLEGDLIRPGYPIAIFIDNINEIERYKDLQIDFDIYNQTKYQMTGWQAYIKSNELKDSSSCGCW